MVKPRLIHKMKVEITKYPRGELQQDDVWRTPLKITREIIEDPDTPRVTISAQVRFGDFETLEPKATGSDEGTDGYLIIEEHQQVKHRFKVNDHVTKIFRGQLDHLCVLLRIVKVLPVAQRKTFGLFRLDFKDDSRGQ